MSTQRKIDKALWKFWQVAHDVSWFVFGDLPLTWELKHKRNMAYFRYTLPEREKKNETWN